MASISDETEVMRSINKNEKKIADLQQQLNKLPTGSFKYQLIANQLIMLSYNTEYDRMIWQSCWS